MSEKLRCLRQIVNQLDADPEKLWMSLGQKVMRAVEDMGGNVDEVLNSMGLNRLSPSNEIVKCVAANMTVGRVEIEQMTGKKSRDIVV